MPGSSGSRTIPLLQGALRPFQQFVRTGVLGAVLLLGSALVALLWSNSPWAASYFRLWESRFVVGPESMALSHTLHEWINDGLMAVFFLLVGLEIKRELLVGELASARLAALPIAAALGGMVVPALIYTGVNSGGEGGAGWGIPMATDIAFALGVLSLLGPRVPVGLKVFLTALAIVDDMGAVLVIALFYTKALVPSALFVALIVVVVLVALNRFNVRSLAPYLVLGVVLWTALLSSGIHATIAGVILALTIPARTPLNAEEFSAKARALVDEFDQAETGDLLVITSKGQQEAIHALEVAGSDAQGPLLRLEHLLTGVVSFGIMPLFALANAGVRVGDAAGLAGSQIAIGAALGLVLGKPAGITLFAWIAVRLRLATLPSGATWPALHGVSWIAGIGFTMSLFIAGLAFGESVRLDSAKVGILAGSLFAALVGSVLLRRNAPRPVAPGRQAQASGILH